MSKTTIWQPDDIASAAAALAAGELVSFPSETVYGLGANAFDEKAVSGVYAAKGRPSDNPLIVHIADRADLAAFAIPNAAAEAVMDAFWPGPLTLILPVKPERLSKTVTGGLDTVAVRMPNHDLTRELIRQAGVPIVGPSANTSGRPSPTEAQHVYHDLAGRIRGILDGGATEIGLESTVIDLSTDQPAVLRPGAITPEALEAVLGVPVVSELSTLSPEQAPKAPGMKYRHYAPDKAVYMVPETDLDAALAWVTEQDVPVGLMLMDPQLPRLTPSDQAVVWSLGADPKAAGRALFGGLRHFDAMPEIGTILVTRLPETSANAAYHNRLDKASGGHLVNELWTDAGASR